MRSAPENKTRLKELRGRLDWLLLILILLFVFVSIILVPTFLTVSGLENVPYALHSVLNADYSADPLALKYSQVKNDIIAQVVKDQNGLIFVDSSADPAINPPIAMTTPLPGLPGTPTLHLLQPSSTPGPMDGVVSPTAPNNDAAPTNGVNPTSTSPVATHNPPNTTMVATKANPSATMLPPTTRPPDSTSIAPTRTVSPATQPPNSTPIAPTRTIVPTSTPIPPSHTPAPTDPPPTNTPRPTDPPPTRTPRPTDPPDPYPPPPPPATPYP